MNDEKAIITNLQNKVDEFESLISGLKSQELPSPKQSQSMALLTSMETSEWYTPEWYINLVGLVFEDGYIDLDPASNETANKTVDAAKIYTLKTDGLSSTWVARNVFLNPPYSHEGTRRATASLWINKALYEFKTGHYTEGIFLLNAKLGYKWFGALVDNPLTTVLLHRERIAFVSPDITSVKPKPSRQPQATVYVGPYREMFISVFGHLGWIL